MGSGPQTAAPGHGSGLRTALLPWKAVWRAPRLGSAVSAPHRALRVLLLCGAHHVPVTPSSLSARGTEGSKCPPGDRSSCGVRSSAGPSRAAPPTTPRPGLRPGHTAAPSGRGGRGGSSHAADGQGAGPGAEARAARSPTAAGAAARPFRPRAAGARGTAGTRPGGQTRRRREER